MYKIPDCNEQVTLERLEDIEDLIETKDALMEFPQEELDSFKLMLSDLYSEVNAPVHKARGDILEAIIYYFGPHAFKITETTEKYNEPNIFDGGFCVGETNHVIDVIFHDSKHEVAKADYIECKASIHSFVDLKRDPLKAISKKVRTKWLYIKNVYSYFKERDFLPVFIIASLTNDVSDYQQQLNKMGFDFVKIINEEDIFNMIS